MSLTAFWLYLGGAMGLALAALGMFAWAMLRDRSRGRRRCPKCWYDIHADSTELPIRCSECGCEIKREKDLRCTRRRWKLAGLSGFILFSAAFLAVQPKVQPYGWGSMTPMSVLIVLLQFDDKAWVTGGIHSQINYDLIHRMRAPDFLDHWEPAKEKAMWRWQWRWLGRTILPRLNDDEIDPGTRRMYFDWIVLCRDFAGDADLRAEIERALERRLDEDDAWARYRGWMLTVDYADIDGSIERLLARFENAPDNSAIWGAMMGVRSIALRDRRGVELLLGFLDHEHPHMRSSAVTCLGFVVRRNGYEAAIHEAVDAMEHDEDCNVRWARIGSLANMLPEKQMWPMVVAAMESDDICVRRGGFGAANTHGWEWKVSAATMPARVVDLAVAFIGDEDETISWSAAWIVQDVAGDRSRRHMLMPHVKAIEAHAEHEDATVQRAVNGALMQLR